MTELTFVPQRQMLRLHHDPEAFATAARVNCVSACARAGVGHLGGSLSAIDIITWLYLREMRPDDVFVLSKGHAALAWYAVLHGVGILSDEQLLTFRDGKGGLSAHPIIGTPGITCNTGSLGMGISKAKGMIFADRLAGVKRRYFVLVGDGELQEGQIWEALMPHAEDPKYRTESKLMVLVDANRIQGNGACDENRTFQLRPLFDAIISDGEDEIDWRAGHSFRWIEESLRDNPPVVLYDTVKGKGVSFMENNPRWHGGAPNEQEYEQALGELLARLPADIETLAVPHAWPAPLEPEELVAAYGQALLDAAERHPELVVLDADLTRECGLLLFKERYPERFFEIGIAEQDMVGIASGMALCGLLPVVHSHAAFLTRRALDQVHNQVSEGTRVVYVGGSAGKLQPNGNGKSHETLVDGDTMALLGIRVYDPIGPDNVRACLGYALEEGTGSAYIRLRKMWR